MSLLKRLAAAVAILACAAGGVLWYRATRTENTHTLVLSGNIECEDADLGSKVGGRVEAVFVAEGDRVERGELLIRLEGEEWRARLGQARAEVDRLRSELELMKNGYPREEIAAAKAEYEAMLHSYKELKLDYERIKELAEEKVLPQHERDRAYQRMLRARYHRDALYQRYLQLKGGYRKEKIAAAEAALRAAEQHVYELEHTVAELEIRAPWDGIIEVLDLREGDMLEPLRPAVRLVCPDSLWVEVYVPEDRLGFVHIGDRVAVKVDSFPERTFDGKITRINTEAEFTPRNIQTPEERITQVFAMRVELDNREGLLRAGMAADVYIPLKDSR